MKALILCICIIFENLALYKLAYMLGEDRATERFEKEIKLHKKRIKELEEYNGKKSI